MLNEEGVGLPPGVPKRFASSGTTKAASTLRSAARTPKHRRSSDAMPENPSPLQTVAPNGLPL